MLSTSTYALFLTFTAFYLFCESLCRMLPCASPTTRCASCSTSHRSPQNIPLTLDPIAIPAHFYPPCNLTRSHHFHISPLHSYSMLPSLLTTLPSSPSFTPHTHDAYPKWLLSFTHVLINRDSNILHPIRSVILSLYRSEFNYKLPI